MKKTIFQNKNNLEECHWFISLQISLTFGLIEDIWIFLLFSPLYCDIVCHVAS